MRSVCIDTICFQDGCCFVLVCYDCVFSKGIYIAMHVFVGSCIWLSERYFKARYCYFALSFNRYLCNLDLGHYKVFWSWIIYWRVDPLMAPYVLFIFDSRWY